MTNEIVPKQKCPFKLPRGSCQGCFFWHAESKRCEYQAFESQVLSSPMYKKWKESEAKAE